MIDVGAVRTARIEAVHTARVDIPVRSDLVVHGARGMTHDRSDFLLVRVVMSDGVEGYGEVSSTPVWSGEDGATADHFIRELIGPSLVGKRLEPVGALEAGMDRVLAGNPFTKAGIAMALWDAYARSLGLPLTVVLGGPFRSEVPIKLGLSGDGAYLDRVYAAAFAIGFRAFKVKVGHGLASDVPRVARARELVGEEAFLGLDANAGWTRAEARRALRELAPYRPAFFEQPVAAADLDGMRELRGEGAYVVADESVFGMEDLVRVVRADATDVISIYVGKCGGPGRAVELGKVAAAFGLDTLLGSNGELGLGAAAQLHIACALPGLSTAIPSDIIGAHYYDDDVLAEPLDSDGVRACLPTGPGLGVSLRPDILTQFR
jgi:L-alanine-DL-glutamate epimerase-like enolase superfamily enzyme